MIPRILLVSLLALGLRAADPTPASPAPPAAPEIRRISDTLFECDGIRFDKQAKTARFDCEVNVRNDLLEYIVVSKGGKTHESLLLTRIEPASLHVVMLLLDAKPSTETGGVTTNSAPWIDAATLHGRPPVEGSPVTLRLEWDAEGATNHARVEDWIFNRRTGYPMKPSTWVYNGSRLIGSKFMATTERSVAALITDPFALVNHTGKGHDDDTIWEALTDRIPPKATRVRLVIQLGPAPGAGDPER